MKRKASAEPAIDSPATGSVVWNAINDSGR